MNMEIIKSDVLVIAPSIAGIRTTVETHDRGASVGIDNTKGLLGKDRAVVWMVAVSYQFSLGSEQKTLEMVAFAPIPPNPEAMVEKAQSTSVKLVPNVKDLAANSRTVFPCVWPSSVLYVASECTQFLNPAHSVPSDLLMSARVAAK